MKNIYSIHKYQKELKNFKVKIKLLSKNTENIDNN